MKKGRLIVISGPSGVGKGTVVRQLMQRHDHLRFSVSATTRAIRPGEQDGVNYYYITHEAFEKLISEDALLEYAYYVNNYYGTPEQPVNELLCRGYDVLLEIEVQGALQVKQHRPDAILIFIAAPSFDELARRLRGRGDTAEDQILRRLETARSEYIEARNYDYIVVNKQVDVVTDEILSILTAESLKAYNQTQLLKEATTYALSPDV